MTERPDLSALARPSGAFAMVALDQRESLRMIFAEQTGTAVGDDVLRRFKVAATQALAPPASGLLLDRALGLDPVLAVGGVPPGPGLIVAADALVQEPGQPVRDSSLDAALDLDELRRLGAVALKYLVIWRDDPDRGRRREDAARFVQAARSAGLLSVLEAVVRPPQAHPGSWDREAAAVEAAGELGSLRPDLYKAEMPFHGQAEAEPITDGARALGDACAGPWVVLSAGVPLDRFEAGVEAACRGGASGFLAGRAIWTDAVALDGVEGRLAERSVPRLRRLGELVDRVARPWHAVTRAHRPTG